MKEKLYKQIYVWLILIFILLLFMFLLMASVFFPNAFCWLLSGNLWAALGSLGTILTLICAIYTYKKDVKHRKKENTLNAFNVLQREVFDTGILPDTFEKSERFVNQWSVDLKKAEEKKNITKCLSRIEHFAVGINSEIYDLETVNRMAGSLLIKKYDTLRPIIDYKNDGKQNYMEFLEMINALIKLRNKSPKFYNPENQRSETCQD